jgi:hypothetical protein
MNILPFEYNSHYPASQDEPTVLVFGDVTLTQQLGKFGIGHQFALACLNFATGEMTFESYFDDDVYRFNVDKLVVK